jgi:hypothetical protein
MRDTLIGFRVCGAIAISMGLTLLFAPIFENLSRDRQWYFHYTAASRKAHD